MKHSLKIFCLIAAVIFIKFISANAEGSHDRAKARYFYLKGAEKEAQEKMDQAYEFYKKAAATDSTYIDGLYSYGMARMSLALDSVSLADLHANLGYMRPLIDAYPKDIDASQTYAYYALLADTLPEAIRVFDIMVREFPGKSSLYIPQAFMFMQAGETERAVKAMREYERLEGASSETTLRKVSYYLAAGDTLSALAEVRDYAESNPGKPSPVIDKAMVYNAVGKPDSAIIFLETALEDFPDNTDIKFDLAMLHVANGDTVRFHHLFAEAFRNDDLDYEDRMEMLKAYLSNLPVGNGNYKESDALFNYADSLYPSDLTFTDLYGSYEGMKGDYSEALEKAKKALSLDPEDVGVLGRVISYSVLADKPIEGVKAFENFPDTIARRQNSIILSYITAAEIAKEFEKALAATESILKRINPAFSLDIKVSGEISDSLMNSLSSYDLNMLTASYEIAGDIYGRKGDQEAAVRNYENSMSIPVDNPSVLNNYAYYIIETVGSSPGSEEFEKAKKLSRQSIEQTQSSPQANYYDTYAWILFKENNYKEALDYQELAIELEGNDAGSELLSHYGDILFMNGRPDEALIQWEKALKQDPDNKLLKKKIENKTFFYE